MQAKLHYWANTITSKALKIQKAYLYCSPLFKFHNNDSRCRTIQDTQRLTDIG